MKILFVQLRFESNMAIMCLSAFLKEKGHETDVIIIEGEQDYISKIAHEIKPDAIGFSATTVDIKRLLSINRQLKEEFSFFSIFGGAHPTFFPEVIEEEDSIDALCVGEGEYALLELLDKLQQGKPIGGIENLHVRGNNGIIKNKLRPLIDNLDILPFLDKHLYDKYYNNPYLRENVPIRFIASRGCPYQCTYCFNHKFFELYGYKGRLIRKRSVESLIREIKEVKNSFKIPMVSFVDDIFCAPNEWVRDFAGKYRSEVALPYSVNTRPNTISEETSLLLESSGCYYVTFSIESGDDFLRNRVLRRNMSEEDIVNASALLHKHRIRFSSGNILGIPGETIETLKKTVRLNQRCGPHYAWASLFQPFPRLELTNYAIEKGYFDGDFSKIGTDQFTDTVLRLKNKREIVRFHKFFALLVKYPFLEPLVDILIKVPFDQVYNWLFRKYKIRLNLPVVRASKNTLEKQYDEQFPKVILFFFKDMFLSVSLFIKKRLNGLDPVKS